MFARLLGGSLSDKYGSSRPMGLALIVASLATALTSLVKTGPALAICRFISGIVSSIYSLLHLVSKCTQKQTILTYNHTYI